MRYLGGKSKIAKRLCDVILKATPRRGRLVEPFMGGGAMTVALAPHFESVSAFDINADLILLWNALRSGWRPPRAITEEQYTSLKVAPMSALRSFVGFGASWGGKWFGGYARGGGRNYADESARSLERDFEKMPNCTFDCLDYQNAQLQPDDVVYCDPPYADTTEYSDRINSERFWDVAGLWASMGAHVFVSEYSCQSTGWFSLWHLERARDMRSKLTNTERVTEQLFTFEDTYLEDIL